MNKKHYNNVIDWTLKHDQAAQTEDSLATARAIFKNMGVALPNGSMQEVYDTIKTNKYMGWKECTLEDAMKNANRGVATIGINENKIVVFSAEDEEQPVAQTASVMTVAETLDPSDGIYFQYYCYNNGTTTIWYFQAVMSNQGAEVWLKPEESADARLILGGSQEILAGGNANAVPLMGSIKVNDRDWHQILYNGMVAYVLAEDCTPTIMLAQNIPAVKEMEVRTTYEAGLAVRNTPFTSGYSSVITRLPNRTVVEVMCDVKQNSNWYAVRATMENGDTTYGWCSSDYLKPYANLFAHKIASAKIGEVLTNIDNCPTNVILASRKPAAKAMARVLLARGYAPALVAGVISNVVSEGDIGHFENSRYISNPEDKPDYLVYMDTKYNGLNFYSNNYSNKKIMDVCLADVDTMLENLRTQSNGTWKIDGSRVGFGLGCIQWTRPRAYTLVKLYVQEANGSDPISEDQAATAEAKMIKQEFELDDYRDHIIEWAISAESTNGVNTVDAAKAAGRCVCEHYEIPDDPDGQKATEREDRAGAIFSAIMASVI